MYRLLFDRVLTKTDPEQIHHVIAPLLSAAGRVPVVSKAVRSARSSGSPVNVMGIDFPGRLGVAGGFDKNATMIAGLATIGFGFVEIGTVTAHAQPGNDKPRLWRHIELRAIRNRMGFNNEGATKVAGRLRRLRRTADGRDLVIGVNIGKTKVTPAEDAAADYAASARQLGPYADFVVINVSSPNTPGLRDLQTTEALGPIVDAVRMALDDVTDRHVPLLVKIAPDLADEDVDGVAALVKDKGLDGVVAVNTTIGHDFGPGGLSGPPVLERGIEVVGRLRRALGEGPAIIGVGGITTVDDARAYLAAGADLLEGYTAFIYEGPGWAYRINRALAAGEKR